MSRQSRRLILALVLIALLCAGTLFYFIQNRGALPGGNIALSKLLWLALVVSIWYVLPAFLLYGKHSASAERMILQVHLANVLARGAVELYMMYVSDNWHPYYGIAHDLLSLALVAALALINIARLSPRVGYFLAVLCATFVVEAGFASYMLTQVVADNGPVYFVPESEEYSFILRLTWLPVAALLLYLFYFAKDWLADAK